MLWGSKHPALFYVYPVNNNLQEVFSIQISKLFKKLLSFLATPSKKFFLMF